VTKVAIELWERAFRLTEQDGDSGSGSAPSRVQIDGRRVSCQSCPISGWSSCSSAGKSIEVSKRMLFKVPQMPLSIWADEPHRIVSSDRRSFLPKGYYNTSGVYSLVRVEIQHTLRVVVYVEGQLSSESASEVSFDVEDTAQDETRVYILGLQEQQQHGESDDETHPPSYHRSFTTVVVEGDRLAEMDRRSFEALQDFEMIMARSSLEAAATVTVAVLGLAGGGSRAGVETVVVTAEPPCYEESIRSSFTSTRGVPSAEWTRGASIDQRSLRDSLWDSNSGRPSTSTDTYTPLSTAS
ncbi:hypothetical protein BGX33_005546, partial [Mortierella sp. NVP41]